MTHLYILIHFFNSKYKGGSILLNAKYINDPTVHLTIPIKEERSRHLLANMSVDESKLFLNCKAIYNSSFFLNPAKNENSKGIQIRSLKTQCQKTEGK